MNLFTQYGIKEVADVMIYSIVKIGDEEIYLPVLYLDTLKISNLEKKEQKVSASSGYGNSKIMSWSFGKDITLKIQDALFTPASLSLGWGGWLEGKMSCAALAIAKITVRNKYYKLNYSPYAYPSPELTEEEWDLIYEVKDSLEESGKNKYYQEYYTKNIEYIEQNRVELRQDYYRKKEKLKLEDWEDIIEKLIEKIKENKVESKINNIKTIDTTELCVVQDRDMCINKYEQQKFYSLYMQNDYTQTYTLFLDEKTLQPLFFNDTSDSHYTILKPGTRYIKLTRYQYIPKNITNSAYGKNLIISCDTFPGYYRIVGTTKVRMQMTGQDQYLQFIIPKAKLTGDTNIKLEAAGDPTVFDMNVEVICPENDVMFELKQFDIEEDCSNGGVHIVPSVAQFTSTRVYNKTDIDAYADDNVEIY